MEIKIYGAFPRFLAARRVHPTLVDFHTGRYFASAVRTRFSLSFGPKWVAEILSLSGVNRPSGPLLYGASPVGTCVEIKFYDRRDACSISTRHTG